MYVDTHAHLYHRRFEDDRDAMLERAFDAGVERIYLPNIDSGSIGPMLDLADSRPGRCLPMMGVHPCSIKADREEEMALAERWLFDPPRPVAFAAVGEIGLDYHWDKTFVEQQREAFDRQIGWAKKLQLPIVIHSRDSLDDSIAHVASQAGDDLRGVFHCYTGDLAQARRILELGFFLGIGGVATFRNGGLDSVLPGLGPESLVLETDAPFLAPVPHRGKRNESAYLPLVAERLAEWFGTDLGEIARITTANAEKLFGPPPPTGSDSA